MITAPNGTSDLLAEVEFDMDKFLGANPKAQWTCLIADYSYMEGTIAGMEKSIHMLKDYIAMQDKTIQSLITNKKY